VDKSVQEVPRDQIAVLTTDWGNGKNVRGVRITRVFDYKKQVEVLGEGDNQSYTLMDIPPGDYGVTALCSLVNLVPLPQLHVIVNAGEIHHIKCMLRTTYAYLEDDVDKVSRKGDPNIFFKVTSINDDSGTLQFKVWHPTLYRFSTKQITVFKSDTADSVTALIEKMKEILHRENQETFVLETHRLRKLATLNTKPENDLAMIQLLREEFSFESRWSK
jgi:hypothetical protein